MMTRLGVSYTSHTMAAWYTVYCKPHKETRAARALEASLGLSVYLPEICVMQQKQLSHVLCFPRYLFVQANLQATPIQHIHAIPGVMRLVGFDAGPQVVPEAVIEAIQQQVEELNHRMHPQKKQPFRQGDAVRLREGPLRGLEGMLVEADSSRQRVKVLIHMLGQLSRAEVDIDALEHVETPSTDHPSRRTRGRGRRIRNQNDRESRSFSG